MSKSAVVRVVLACLAWLAVGLPPAVFADGTISYGRTVSGQITDSDNHDWWRFTGSAGDVISIGDSRRP